MRSPGRLIGVALLLILARPGQASQSPGDEPLTRQDLLDLPPAEVARRALGALAGRVRSVAIDDTSRIENLPLSSVTMRFQPTSLSTGVCAETLLTVFFTAIDPARTFGPNPETAPVRAASYSKEERFRITGPLSPTSPAATDPAEASRACAAGSDEDLYFSTGGVGPISPALEAIERTLIELRGEAEARTLIGKLVHVDWGACTSRAPSCIRVTARISENGLRRAMYGYSLVIEEVRYDGRLHPVSIGHRELVPSAIIPH